MGYVFCLQPRKRDLASSTIAGSRTVKTSRSTVVTCACARTVTSRARAAVVTSCSGRRRRTAMTPSSSACRGAAAASGRVHYNTSVSPIITTAPEQVPLCMVLFSFACWQFPEFVFLRHACIKFTGDSQAPAAISQLTCF